MKKKRQWKLELNAPKSSEAAGSGSHTAKPSPSVLAGGERREVQFVIERPCSQLEQRLNAAPFPGSRLPFCVWVYWPPEEPIQNGCDSKVAYCLTDRSYREFLAHIGSKRSRGAYVCEHMGRVIE